MGFVSVGWIPCGRKGLRRKEMVGCVSSSSSSPGVVSEMGEKRSRRLLGSVALASATMMWAASNAIQRQVILAGLNPSMVTAARFGGSGLLFIPELRKRYLGVGFRLALLSFLGNAALSTSLKFTSAARAGFFCAMSVVMTPLLAALVRKEYPERKHIIASAIAAFGVFLMAKEKMEGSSLSPLGDILSLLAAGCFAFYTVCLGIEAPKYDTRRLTAALRVCNGIISVSWALSDIFFSIRAGSNFVLPTISAISTVTWMGLGALTVMLAMSGLLQVFGQKRLSPPQSALIFSLVPLWSAIIGFILLKEVMSPIAIVGGAVLIGGCMYGQLSSEGNVKKL